VNAVKIVAGRARIERPHDAEDTAYNHQLKEVKSILGDQKYVMIKSPLGVHLVPSDIDIVPKDRATEIECVRALEKHGYKAYRLSTDLDPFKVTHYTSVPGIGMSVDVYPRISLPRFIVFSRPLLDSDKVVGAPTNHKKIAGVRCPVPINHVSMLIQIAHDFSHRNVSAIGFFSVHFLASAGRLNWSKFLRMAVSLKLGIACAFYLTLIDVYSMSRYKRMIVPDFVMSTLLRSSQCRVASNIALIRLSAGLSVPSRVPVYLVIVEILASFLGYARSLF
jgi:hypothetical protein